jgi:hypothetical protein
MYLVVFPDSNMCLSMDILLKVLICVCWRRHAVHWSNQQFTDVGDVERTVTLALGTGVACSTGASSGVL